MFKATWKDRVLETTANVRHNQILALLILAACVTALASMISGLTAKAWCDIFIIKNN